VIECIFHYHNLIYILNIHSVLFLIQYNEIFILPSISKILNQITVIAMTFSLIVLISLIYSVQIHFIKASIFFTFQNF